MSSVGQDLEKWGADVIFGREKGFWATVARLVFRVFSWLFALLVRLRLLLFRSGLRDQARLGVQVISIGNLTMGGTGKTPVVEFFSKALLARGRRPVILSRGYKSRKLEERQVWRGEREEEPGDFPKVVSDGENLRLLVEYAGDEPFMLAKNLLPGVAVVVDRDRIKGGRFAVRELGADILLLDDGLQYLKLAHAVDVVLVDAEKPFGTEALIPRGTLREPPCNLARANYIFVTRCHQPLREDQIARLQRYNKTAPIIQTNHVPQHLEKVFAEGERLPLEALQGKFVAAISGIAVPESFERLLRELGAEVLFHRTFGDHQVFPLKDVDALCQRALRRDADLIVTTEKDAVRFPRPTEMIVPIYFLRIEVEIIEGEEEWQACLERICHPPELTALEWWQQRLLSGK
ncbi:tetraacyldisaccharide 4'-kinase [Roseibacillus ishigakijimensis]|uniref:Tetraacyldisaccharide 4'-kinase n=1 Tax=Roseibacillus ishigakijimensis TaxID=454146 RepID=A0A934RNH3_9BACT|nr:tetraacyldisaccharide 4'-kinase [Roseibacillus ishigakijimensis]